jgi:type IV secretory pathway TraG/TraD family ATPase VirD4
MECDAVDRLASRLSDAARRALDPYRQLAAVPAAGVLWWWFSYDAYAPGTFVEGALIAASGGFVSVAVAIAMSVWRAREAQEAKTYGSARWATTKEIGTAAC